MTRNHKVNCGCTMRFVDKHGNEYPEAFFIPLLSIDPNTKTLIIAECFYRSKDSFDNGDPVIPESDGGIRRLIYQGEEYDKYLANHQQLVFQIASAIHQTFKDIKDTPKEGGGYESYFENASEIILPNS